MSKARFAAVVGVAFGLTATGAFAGPDEFAGFYAGAHFGYIHGHAEVDSDSMSESGSMGGVQAGFNFVNGGLMYGLETDISLNNAGPEGGCDYVGGTCDFDTGPMASLRARVGYTNDKFLVFATGGIVGTRFDLVSFDGGGARVDDVGRGAFGWTVGAGVEYMLGDVTSVKLEYRYVNLQETDFNSFTAGDTDVDMDFHSIMAGVNWHF